MHEVPNPTAPCEMFHFNAVGCQRGNHRTNVRSTRNFFQMPGLIGRHWVQYGACAHTRPRNPCGINVHGGFLLTVLFKIVHGLLQMGQMGIVGGIDSKSFVFSSNHCSWETESSDCDVIIFKMLSIFLFCIHFHNDIKASQLKKRHQRGMSQNW